MVEKVIIMSPPNVLDFARYHAGRNAAKAASPRGGARKLYAD